VAYQDALRLGCQDPAVLLALAKAGRRLRIDIMGFVESKARVFLKNMAVKRRRRLERALGRLGLSVKGEVK
jgi:hypothetical protein